MYGNLYLFLRMVKLFGVWFEFLLGVNILNKYNKLKDFYRMLYELKIKLICFVVIYFLFYVCLRFLYF